MLVLGIETATPWGSLALCDDDEIILEVSLKVSKGGGEYLLAMLDLLIQKCGRKLSDLNLIAVGTGPGSYTGIRVGLATVQGLAEALQVPVVGVSTLRVIAENARYGCEWVGSMIDARRGDVYAALYQSTVDGLLEVLPPEAISALKFREKFATLSKVLLCGDGSRAYPEIWSGIQNIQIGPKEWDRPLASRVGLYGSNQWELGLTQRPEELHPTYLRRVEAEVRLEERTNAD